MRAFCFGKVFILNHAKSIFSRVFSPGFASSDFCLRPKIGRAAADTEASRRTQERVYGSIQLCLNIWFLILAMKMLAKATSIVVPVAVPWVCGQLLPQNLNEVSFNVIGYFSQILGRYPWGYSGEFWWECAARFSNPDPISTISDQKCYFPYPFSGLVS